MHREHRASNIIVVDWSELSGSKDLNLTVDTDVTFASMLILYNEVKSEVEFVGRRLAKFLLTLVDLKKISLDKLHFIGYSLGAHGESIN